MGRGVWDEGRRAWERLNGWHQDSPSDSPGHPDDGDGAVEALVDIGQVRRLLDQAELVAVRTARRHGKSWAEIATKLGVTRQSAWERWRDLDDVPAAEAGRDPGRDPVGNVEAAAERSAEDEHLSPRGRRARELRRRSSVVVPSVVGRSWRDARQRLHEIGLVVVSPDQDDLPSVLLDGPEVVVTDQSPESGALVPPGSTVTLWVNRGGGSAGVREPRRPTPLPRTGRKMQPEPSDEAVG